MEPPELRSLAEQIAALAPEQRQRAMARLAPAQREHIRYVWAVWERLRQREPDLPWRTWLVLAGRGFGKTRMGAEWVRRMAKAEPMARIAMVGATLAEARAVMVEGDSGILAVCPPDERPAWEPSLGRLRFPGGARADPRLPSLEGRGRGWVGERSETAFRLASFGRPRRTHPHPLPSREGGFSGGS